MFPVARIRGCISPRDFEDNRRLGCHKDALDCSRLKDPGARLNETMD